MFRCLASVSLALLTALSVVKNSPSHTSCCQAEPGGLVDVLTLVNIHQVVLASKTKPKVYSGTFSRNVNILDSASA